MEKMILDRKMIFQYALKCFVLMSLSNEVLKWRYVSAIYVVALQMGINISQSKDDVDL